MASSRVFEAIDFAVQAHRDQFRKGTSIPYVVHPINVGRILIEVGCAEPVALAGFLHDTLEDSAVTLKNLTRAFGEDVADLVARVSEGDKSEPWEQRKRKMMDSLRAAPEDVLVLALADKLDNIRSIRDGLRREGEGVWERFKRPKEDQAWYHKTLVALFENRIDCKSGRELLSEFRTLVQEVFEG